MFMKYYNLFWRNLEKHNSIVGKYSLIGILTIPDWSNYFSGQANSRPLINEGNLEKGTRRRGRRDGKLVFSRN